MSTESIVCFVVKYEAPTKLVLGKQFLEKCQDDWKMHFPTWITIKTLSKSNLKYIQCTNTFAETKGLIFFWRNQTEVYTLSSNQENQLFKKNSPGFPQSPNLHVWFR